jgi:hypothetical protein
MSSARSGTAILVIVMALTACSSPGADGSYELAEFSISGPTTTSSGEQTLEVTNSGEFSHTLLVTDIQGGVVAATELIPAGETGELTLDLEPGRYSFTCRIVAQDSDGNIVDHFEAGMSTTVIAET